jgi:hypothetical protein
MRWINFPVFFVWLLFSGCYYISDQEKDSFSAEGFRPVYGTMEETAIKFKEPRPVKNPGKIYVYGNYLLVNEVKEGIHVFDNAIPSEPKALGFIHLPGNTEMAIRNNILYVDHLGSLVALNTSDFSSFQERARLPLRNWFKGVPPPVGYYFECVDAEKGYVLSWEKTQLNNPSCYAIQ